MTEPVWLSRTAVLAMHERLLAEHGGLSGLRDGGLLESALARPRNAFHYGETIALASLAAITTAAIIRNHPFVDGNKRTGFLAGVVFLGRNGLRLRAPEPLATSMTYALASGEADEETYARFMTEHTRA